MKERAVVVSSHSAIGSDRRTTEWWVADALRERIMTGDAPVGTRLRQADLSADLGVSTTPVREALRALAAEGLVRIDAHRGAVVRGLDTAESIEVLELLAVLEIDNLRHAIPRLTEADLAAAEAVQRQLRRARPNRWVVLNRDFHLALAAPSGRPRCLALLRELLNLTALHIRTELDQSADRVAQALGEHDELIAACRARDPEAAADVLRRHTGYPLGNLRAR